MQSPLSIISGRSNSEELRGVDPEMKGSVWLGFRRAMDLAKARIFGKPKL